MKKKKKKTIPITYQLNWVNIGSVNGLLPDGTKPLHESTLFNY